jgi:hypothetical protein
LVKWLKQYGREDILPKRIKVETMDEVDEMFEIQDGYRAVKPEAGYEPAELLQRAEAAGSGRRADRAARA